MNPLNVQVGGNHYKNLEIQPIEFINRKCFQFCVGNVVKYLVRDKGNRLEDLEKAYHYLDLEDSDIVFGTVGTGHIVNSYLKDPFFKQFKNGRKYAQIVAYSYCGRKAKAKELLRKFINKGDYSEV